MPTRKLFNTKTQTVEDAELTVDANSEIVATFSDGNFIKFPAGLSKKDFENLIVLHQKHNEGQVIITPEMEAAQVAAKANSEALIAGGDATD